MNVVKNMKEETAEVEHPPQSEMPGDGAGRVEGPGARGGGVWPGSGPPSGTPEARIHGMASFGQGQRSAAGYEDSGQSEVVTLPPGDTPAEEERASAAGRERGTGATASGIGDVGSNAGEVDPGISGSGETVGETPGDVGGAGFGNAVGGGDVGDVPQSADRPRR
jgi:hypothetical protein